MQLVVISHKICWQTQELPAIYATDGGFPLQMEAISELFDGTKIVVPVGNNKSPQGISPLSGNNLKIKPLSVPKGQGLRRKINIMSWIVKNGVIIWREVRKADAVHTPIPGDVGTIGMLFALILRKPLFVRHCGNWFVQKTFAEKFWKWSMEKFAGGKNIMFATGGAPNSPSNINKNIKWIFSTSLKKHDLNEKKYREYPIDGEINLIIACRQEKRKGTDIVIESLPMILKSFPKAKLHVIGDGTLLPKLKQKVEKLNLNKNVIFYGRIEQSRVKELMKGGHLFCYPTSASEGFPKVVLEALSCGLPVITTNVSVLPELIQTNCGLILKEISADELAQAVVKIGLNKDLYQQLSLNAIIKAQEYTLENWRDFIGNSLRKDWQVESLSANSKTIESSLLVN